VHGHAMRTVLLACVLAGANAGASDAVKLVNPGLEDVGKDKTPIGWVVAEGRAAQWVTEESPHNGRRAGRVVGDGSAGALRQAVASPATRIYTASGWFRGRGVKIDKAKDDYARFYFHILYKDRPYSDTTHAWVDLPVGTYDWRRVAVQLVPQTQWPIDAIRMTVAARFSDGTLDFDDVDLRLSKPRGGAVALAWTRHAEGVMLSDMGQIRPTWALTARARRGHWKLIDYEAGGITGKLIWASAETNAPPVTLGLGVRGWHAIFLGLTDPAGLGCKVWVKLGRDPAPVARVRTTGHIEDVFFKVANLKDDVLQIAQQASGRTTGCGVAYVKLIPLTPKEIAAVRVERKHRPHRRLTASLDGFSFIYDRRPTTAEALLAEVEVYRHTDFDTLILQMGGADQVNYPSDPGQMMGQDLDDFARAGDGHYAAALRELARQRINPTKVLIDGAHDVGMKVHVAVRPAAWVHSEPLADFFRSRFYQSHPEWRCVDRDGTPVARMSLAVPEVRRHLVTVLNEAVRLGADGAHVIYARGVPLVLYERPFLDRFRERFKLDARELDESDERIGQLRCEVLTALMGEIRAMLDAEQSRRADGKRLALSAFVLADASDNVRYGIDVRRWVNDGLLDMVFPYIHAGGTRARAYDMEFFNEVCKPKGVPVRPTFVGWQIRDLKVLVRQGTLLYEQGADGITFWDANAPAVRADRWSVVSRFGHTDELRARRDEGIPRTGHLRFHRLGELIMDGRYSPNWGF